MRSYRRICFSAAAGKRCGARGLQRSKTRRPPPRCGEPGTERLPGECGGKRLRDPEEGAADADEEDRTEPAEDEANSRRKSAREGAWQQPEAEGGVPAEKPEENGQSEATTLVPEKSLPVR